VGEQIHDEGTEESPWMSMLHPAANARALGEIQRRGLRAAGELVDRLIGAVDGDRHQGSAAAGGAGGASVRGCDEEEGAEGGGANDDGGGGGGGGGDGAPRAPGGSVTGSPPADLLHVWVDVFQRGLQAMAAMARPGGTLAAGDGSIATADVGRGTVTGAVDLAVGADRSGEAVARPNGRAQSTDSAEVWLHNGTAETRTGLRFHSGDLRAHDGATLPASALRFDPPSLDDLPARSSRGIVVAADVEKGVPDGVYRGVLLVAGVPDVWLPIVVTVANGG
jgi:hypothetical protein